MSVSVNILSIDIDAALRKLTEKRFKSVDDPALVLVRFAAAGGPTALRVQFRNRQLTIETSGPPVDPTPFRLLGTLFDTAATKETRSRALGELEHSVGLDILAAFAGAPSQVVFTWNRDDAVEGIRFVPDERPSAVAAPIPTTLTIHIRGGLPSQADPIKIAEKCRFSQIPVYVNGHLTSNGIKVEGSLIRQKLNSDNRVGVVGIPKEGDLTQITLLDNGIVSDELYMPAQGGLVFSATVHGTRADFQEFYPKLREAAKRLLVPLAKGYPSISKKRQRLAEIRLFDRYEVTRDDALVQGVNAFRTVDGAKLDLPWLLAAAKNGDLYAIDEGAPVSSFAVKNRKVVVVDRRQRRFLDALLPTPLKTPPKRIATTARPLPFKDRIRSLLGRLTPARPLPASALSSTERRFVDALVASAERHRAPVSVAMTDSNHYPPRAVRTPDGLCYLIPRRHPIVRRVMADVLRDPAYLKPAFALLVNDP